MRSTQKGILISLTILIVASIVFFIWPGPWLIAAPLLCIFVAMYYGDKDANEHPEDYLGFPGS